MRSVGIGRDLEVVQQGQDQDPGTRVRRRVLI